MKLILIVIAVIIQLSFADETTINVVQPPNDKLYPIFELIAIKMQENYRLRMSWIGRIYEELLPKYIEFMETHNTKPFEDFRAAIEKLLSTVQQFEEDPENCQLQRAALIDVGAVYEKKPDDDDLYEFLKSNSKDKDMQLEQDDIAILEISNKFPELIEKFIESLNEEEKQKYSKLCKYGEEILKAAEGTERFSAIARFMNETEFHKNLTEATDENCKWDSVHFHTFRYKISSLITYVGV